MLPRRKSRILALCMLYALDMQRTDDLSVASRIESIFSRPFPQSVTDYACFLARGVVKNAEKIDELIFRHTHNWDKERIAMVDRQVMRISICEFVIKRSAPAVVAINEAVAIAKIFGTEESGRFVNGILDAVNVEINNLVREEPPKETEEKSEAPSPETKQDKAKITRSAYLARYAREAAMLEKEKEAKRAAIEAEREAEREERRKAREAEREARRAQREAEKLEEEY